MDNSSENMLECYSISPSMPVREGGAFPHMRELKRIIYKA